MPGHFSKIKLMHDDGTETVLIVRAFARTTSRNAPTDWNITAVETPSPATIAYSTHALQQQVQALKGGISWAPNLDPYDPTKPVVPIRVLGTFPPACECGKDKHNFFKHTDWCPIKD